MVGKYWSRQVGEARAGKYVDSLLLEVVKLPEAKHDFVLYYFAPDELVSFVWVMWPGWLICDCEQLLPRLMGSHSLAFSMLVGCIVNNIISLWHVLKCPNESCLCT